MGIAQRVQRDSICGGCDSLLQREDVLRAMFLITWGRTSGVDKAAARKRGKDSESEVLFNRGIPYWCWDLSNTVTLLARLLFLHLYFVDDIRRKPPTLCV